jgi:glycosyltransferase involved in cell wall biosynthesis
LKALIFSAFDPIPSDEAEPIRYVRLVEQFMKNGHEVHYISFSFFHLLKKERQHPAWFKKSLPGNLKLQLIKSPSYKKNVSFARLYSHTIGGLRLRHYLNTIADSELPDLVIAATPPLAANFFLLRWAKKRNIPVILDIQDIWPEPFAQAFPSKGFAKTFLFPLYEMASRSIRMAAAITSMSEDLIRFHAKDIGDKAVRVFHLGIDTGRFKEVQEGETGTKKRIVYLGSAQSNRLYEIADIAGKLKSAELHIIGTGSRTAEYEEYCRNKGYHNIFFKSWMAFDEFASFLPGCDLGLLWPPADANIAFPNKVFAYLAAGLPVLSNLKGGELEVYLDKHNLGITAKPDMTSLKPAIEAALSKYALADRIRIQQFARQHLDSGRIYESYFKWCMEIYRKGIGRSL